MGLFSKNYTDKERELRMEIQDLISNVPGLFEGEDKTVMTNIKRGLTSPGFEPTKSTVIMDENIKKLLNNIMDIIHKLKPDKDSVKLYQDLLIDMFLYRNSPEKKCKGREYEDIIKDWNLEENVNRCQIEIDTYTKKLSELDKNSKSYEEIKKCLQFSESDYNLFIESKLLNTEFENLLKQKAATENASKNLIQQKYDAYHKIMAKNRKKRIEIYELRDDVNRELAKQFKD